MPYLPPVAVALADLIGTVSPIYPEARTWEATTEYLLNDPIEKETLTELLATLEREGKFREEVVVGMSDFGGDEGIESAFVLNGTHRVVAHILFGSEFIDVSYESDTEEESESRPDDHLYRVLETVVEFDTDLNDDDSDTLFNVLRSFRVSDDIWVTSDVMSGTLSRYATMWSLEDADDALIELVNQKCIERISQYLSVKPRSVITRFDEFTDED